MKADFHSVKWLILGFVLGVFVAICISPLFHAKRLVPTEPDTTRTEITQRYGKLELHTKTSKLEVPNIGTAPHLVFVPEEKTTVIVKDSVSYVMMDRSFFYTETKDAKIWHSGVDSTIDSLVVTSWNERITTTYREPHYYNSLSFYGGVGYDGMKMVLPIGMEFLYHPKKWIGFGARMEYDACLRNMSVLATTRLTFRW